MYAIVDIETTGGNAVSGRITEVAVFVHDGTKVIEKFETLVNPGRVIPRYITALTGISHDMVAGAPSFEEIAEKLHSLLEGKVFIAHNVNFDFSFLKNEFEMAGKPFTNKRLCTVRLSKKIIPGLPTYSLGRLCDQVGIDIENRHRAGGDAAATVKLFEMLLARDKDNFIGVSLKKNSREAVLPPHLPKEDFESLPNKPGVYYFHDQKGRVIYVGKAVDLKKRVAGHFTGNSETRRKDNMISSIYRISYQLCGNDLLALLYEAYEIKRLWPEYNSAQKRVSKEYGIYQYEDQNGYMRLGVNQVRKMQQPLKSFRLVSEARMFIESKAEEYKLCPRLAGLHITNDACFDYPHKCDGACVKKVSKAKYNRRFKKALASLDADAFTFAVVGEGRGEHERSVVLVEKGMYRGFGYIEKEKQLTDLEAIKENLGFYTDGIDAVKLIDSYLVNANDEVVVF